MLCKACCNSSRNLVPPCVRAWLRTVEAVPQARARKPAHRDLPTAAWAGHSPPWSISYAPKNWPGS